MTDPRRKEVPRPVTPPADQPWPGRFGWFLLVILICTSLGLGAIGFGEIATSKGTADSWPDRFYMSLQLFALESGAVVPPVPLTLQVARYLAPLLAASAAVLAFLAVFRQQAQRWRRKFMRGHVVVCGLGRTGSRLAQSLREAGQRVIVVDVAPDDAYRAICKRLDIPIVEGDARDIGTLRDARIHRATHLIAVCGRDGVNADVAAAARRVNEQRRDDVMTCFLHVDDPDLCELLREKEMSEATVVTMRLEFFNLFETSARTLLRAVPPVAPANDGSPAISAGPRVLVIGLGHGAESIVMQAARDWFEPARVAGGDRARLTMMAPGAVATANHLRARLTQLERCCDLRAEDVEVTPAAFLTDHHLREIVTASHGPIYVCLASDELGLAVGIVVQRCLAELGRATPVVVVMNEDAGLGQLLVDRSPDIGEFRNLTGFPFLDRSIGSDLLESGVIEVIARHVHDQFQSLVNEGHHVPGSQDTGNAWADLPESAREDNRRHAEHLRDLLARTGHRIVLLSDWDAPRRQFAPEEIDAMACAEHERWCEQKRRDGFKLGTGRRRNPHLMEWDDLPPEVQELNRELIRGLPSRLVAAGFQVTACRV